MRTVNMKTLLAVVVVAVGLPTRAMAQDESTGFFSLVTNPPVMVYVDGHRLRLSPIVREVASAGEHSMTLLLILPNGNRLRADYRLLVAVGEETFASLNLVTDAPPEGEVRTLAPPARTPPAPPAPPPPSVSVPPPVANADPAPPVPPTPPVAPAAPAAPTPPGGGSWATDPGHPPAGPIAVDPAPDPAPPPPEETGHGLSREMVREGLEALRPAVVACMEGQAGVIQIRMIIQPDGGVSDVEAQGVYRGTTVDECVARDLPEEAAFPIYDGEPISVVFPYRISQ
jgi:hypothetical protein